MKNLLNKVKNNFPFLEKIFQNKLAVIPILLILPYFLRENYYLAKISVFAAIFGTLLLLVTHFFGEKDHINIPIVILIFAAAIILWINPINVTRYSPVYDKDTTYLSYNLDCDVCRASYTEMKNAAMIYKITHPSAKIQLVDLKKDDELTKELSKNIVNYGTISKYKDDKFQQAPYSAKNPDGTPKTTKAKKIYNIIKLLN